MKHRLRWLLAPALVAALLPALAIGAAAARPDAPGLRPKPQPPTTVADENVGVFSTLCAYTHRASDDPIVHPGMPGMSHSHDFFGNVTTDADSTYSTMRAGGTTCRAREDAS